MLCLYLISQTTWLFPFSNRGRKSIGRIMMLLSVPPLRLYIHRHQFTTRPLDLNRGFHASALLFICNSCRCGGERTCVLYVCMYMLVCVCVLEVEAWRQKGHEEGAIRKLERREKRKRRCEREEVRHHRSVFEVRFPDILFQHATQRQAGIMIIIKQACTVCLQRLASGL